MRETEEYYADSRSLYLITDLLPGSEPLCPSFAALESVPELQVGTCSRRLRSRALAKYTQKKGLYTRELRRATPEIRYAEKKQLPEAWATWPHASRMGAEEDSLHKVL